MVQANLFMFTIRLWKKEPIFTFQLQSTNMLARHAYLIEEPKQIQSRDTL